jgi:hypothetical protein
MKPCPFCGNKLETAPDGVFEETCRCRTKSMTVKEWNTRPIEDVLRSENTNLQKLVDAKQNRCAELESRLDLYHGNMYDVACQENDKLQSALTAANKWVSVKDALPECKKSVFISCTSPHTGNRFTQKAVYISPKTVLADDFLSDECDCSDGIMEYDDENDCYWVTEGWFEDSLEAEINYHITWEVTHWQPLPPPPTEETKNE